MFYFQRYKIPRPNQLDNQLSLFTFFQTDKKSARGVPCMKPNPVVKFRRKILLSLFGIKRNNLLKYRKTLELKLKLLSLMTQLPLTYNRIGKQEIFQIVVQIFRFKAICRHFASGRHKIPSLCLEAVVRISVHLEELDSFLL